MRLTPSGKSFADLTLRALTRSGKATVWDLRQRAMDRSHIADIMAARAMHSEHGRRFDRRNERNPLRGGAKRSGTVFTWGTK